jgi:hypothetical protein
MVPGAPAAWLPADLIEVQRAVQAPPFEASLAVPSSVPVGTPIYLEVEAFDAVGLSHLVDQAISVVSAADVAAPTGVAFLSAPTALTAGEPSALMADAIEAGAGDRGIYKTRYFLNGALLGEDRSAPFVHVLSVPGIQGRPLARAYRAARNSDEGNPILRTVIGPGRDDDLAAYEPRQLGRRQRRRYRKARLDTLRPLIDEHRLP